MYRLPINSTIANIHARFLVWFCQYFSLFLFFFAYCTYVYFTVSSLLENSAQLVVPILLSWWYDTLNWPFVLVVLDSYLLDSWFPFCYYLGQPEPRGSRVAGLTALRISGCLGVVDSPVSVFRIHMRISSFLLHPLL